jgi:hypothetical protein
MAYSDSDNEFLDMYSDEENDGLASPQHSGFGELGQMFNQPANKCKS